MGNLVKDLLSVNKGAGFEFEFGIRQPVRGARGGEFGAGPKGLFGPRQVLLHPVEVAQCHLRGRQLGIECQGLVKLGLHVCDLSLAEVERAQGQVVPGPVLVLLAQLLDLVSGGLHILEREGGLGQDEEGILLARLLLKDAVGIIPGLFELVKGEFGQTQFQAELGILRVQLLGSFQHDERLGEAALVVVNEAQSGHGDGVGRRDLEDLEVFDLGLFILAGGKVLVGPGEVVAFLGLFGATGAEQS